MALNDRPLDIQIWDDIAVTPNDFKLHAGVFGLTLTATWGGGNAVLQRYLPEGAGFYIPVAAAFTADGYAVYYLPAGRYKLAITTATHTTGRIEKISSGLGE